MEVDESNSRRATPSILLERQSCRANGGESNNFSHHPNASSYCGNMNGSQARNYHHHQLHPHNHGHSHHHQYSGGQNIEIDWREVDPYFSELSDCASFWTLINFTCDVIYSGLFVLFFIMGQDVESMFFEGLLNHINPILIYLILSLVINYGALRSLRCGREKFFLVFSVMKAILFPVTFSLLAYLVFFDVQEYFGTFWVSFVAIVSCYNGTAALGLWSMFTCNKYILVNEAAQKRMRKLAKNQQQQQRSTNYEPNCSCRTTALTAAAAAAMASPAIPATTRTSAGLCENKQISSSFSRVKPTPSSSSHSRRIGDSSCANNPILGCMPESGCSTNCGAGAGANANNYSTVNKVCCSCSRCVPSRLPISAKDDKRTIATSSIFLSGSGGGRISSIINIEDDDDNDEYEDVLSFGDEEDEEVLQISTVHKVMQEIRLLDAKRSRPRDRFDTSEEDDGDSL